MIVEACYHLLQDIHAPSRTYFNILSKSRSGMKGLVRAEPDAAPLVTGSLVYYELPI